MVAHRTEKFDETTDLVVVGSGGAALAAAVRAVIDGSQVVLLEKESTLGGTTGVSGGGVWIPNNRHLAAEGLEDDFEDAAAYITHIANGQALDPSLIDTFVRTAPEMLAYMEEHTPLETQRVSNLHDYYEAIRHRVPGCKDFSRTVEPKPFPARELLGDWADKVAARSTLLSLGADTTLKEDETARGRGGTPVSLEVLAERERAGVRVKGAALVGALLHTIVERGGDVRISSPARRLVVDDDGSVLGVLYDGPDGPRTIGARQGVLLACGGFEWNTDMVLAYLGYEVQPLSPGGNTGDGHLMAMEVRAKMGNMGSYWGQGASFDPAIVREDGRLMPQMMRGLGPGSIIVNSRGDRFTDVALTYNDFPKVFGNFDQELPGRPNLPPAWVVFGPTARNRGPILTIRPEDPTPEWMNESATLEELAHKIGVDAAGLAASVARYDADANDGVDTEFATAAPTPIGDGPFYAVQQWPATLGTNGGCRIDEDGRVLSMDGDVIDGLYAAGNTTAAVLGGGYLGGGTPIACGMTFGYRAGAHAAARQRRTLPET